MREGGRGGQGVRQGQWIGGWGGGCGGVHTQVAACQDCKSPWQWFDSGRVTVTAHALKCKLPEGYDQQTNPSKREKKKKQEENDRQTLPEAC